MALLLDGGASAQPLAGYSVRAGLKRPSSALWASGNNGGLGVGVGVGMVTTEASNAKRQCTPFSRQVLAQPQQLPPLQQQQQGSGKQGPPSLLASRAALTPSSSMLAIVTTAPVVETPRTTRPPTPLSPTNSRRSPPARQQQQQHKPSTPPPLQQHQHHRAPNTTVTQRKENMLPSTTAGAAVANTQRQQHQRHAQPQPQQPVPPPQRAARSSSSSSSSSWWGLPPSISDVLAARGIPGLYAWQRECLNHPNSLHGRSLLYSLPTSGGKTLVAEISLLKCVVVSKKSAIMIVPYVSLVQEKVRQLEEYKLVSVEAYFGFVGRMPVAPQPHLLVCTMEKASGVVNHLLETNRLSELGMVVVDEIHMLGDRDRGHVLEATLAKVLHFGHGRIQILGMSATVDNLPELCAWLGAAQYTGDFRPVPLTEYVVVLEQPPKSRRGASSSSFLRCNVQRKAATGALEPIEYKKLSGMRSDTDVVFALCTEQPDLSVLLFCATKRLTLEEAKAITSRLRAQQQQQQQQQQQAVREASRDKLLEQRAKLALKFAHDEVLRETIPFGVAYHHAGLTAAERARIEKAFRTNVLSILTCTSTLAAGVNLPAKRVIIRSPFSYEGGNGKAPLAPGRYKQMAGRAGRAGLAEFGECFLLTPAHDKHHLASIFSVAPEHVTSSLESRIERLVVDVICLQQELPRYPVEMLLKFFTSTLYFRQKANKSGTEQALGQLQQHVYAAIEALAVRRFLHLHTELPTPPSQVATPTPQAPTPTPTPMPTPQAPTPTPTQMPTPQAPTPPQSTPLPAAASSISTAERLFVTPTPPSPASSQALSATPGASQPYSSGSPAACVAPTLVRPVSAPGGSLATAGPAVPAESPPRPSSAPGGSSPSATRPVNLDGASISPTKLALAAFRAGLPSLLEAHYAFADMSMIAMRGVILQSDLHVCFMCVPAARESLPNVKLTNMPRWLGGQDSINTKVAAQCGIPYEFVENLANPARKSRNSELERRAHRLCCSLMLLDLISEKHVSYVASKYEVDRGDVAMLLDSSAQYARKMVVFCQTLNDSPAFASIAALLQGLMRRLDFGVKVDIVELVQIKGVKQTRARMLAKAGYKSAAAVAAADPKDLASKVNNPKLSVRIAERIIANAKELVRLLEHIQQAAAEHQAATSHILF